MMMAGFTSCSMGPNVVETIRKLIKQYCDRYTLKEEMGALLFGWEDKSLIVSSAWRRKREEKTLVAVPQRIEVKEEKIGEYTNQPIDDSQPIEMSKVLQQPIGQKRLTNVAVVRLKKHGELQVAGKERESQLSSQFRDIATIVMQKTINAETQRPYTISMIERLMHEIHFAVDPHSSSKKQALEVIRELQKHFPIKRSPMRLRLIIAKPNLSTLLEKLNPWNATIVSKDESGSQLSVICELDPGFFRECDVMVRNLQGRLEILAMSVHFEGDTSVDDYDDHEDVPSSLPKESTDSVVQLSEKLQKQTVSTDKNTEGEAKQHKCNTCNAFVGDAKQYRDHFKSEWHKHNLKRKTKQLPPLTAEECLADVDLDDSKADLKEYSF
ncbi:hypothetical protein GH714_021845 [Hevea brasiliensis]|uniref:U1-type domain-containing protein n=1 Tax=Hevea brasiliensis TaxID=3981 RepID=A0A6A6LZI8_HEVBR|nr:hypothetical protein GH714_021845 [Hevea brasiliensis]